MSFKDTLGDFLHIHELKENITTLVEAKIELVKLDFQEKIENIVVQVLYVAVLAFLSFVVAIFLAILLAVFLNHWLKSDYWGFLIVSFVFASLLAIWISAKDAVSHRIKEIAEKITDEQLKENHFHSPFNDHVAK